MTAEPKFSRLVLVSPWTLLIFLVIPLLVILSVTLHVRLPLVGSTTPLLVNNVCFAVVAAARLLRYLIVMGKPIRYGGSVCRAHQSVTLPAPVEHVRAALENDGYACDASGMYAEKRDLGYLGTTVLYAGLSILLSVGCWDNLRQFSGVLLDGIGPATNLDRIASYRFINRGPLAASPATLPKLQIISQSLPDDTYPKGATDVYLTGKEGKAEKHTLIPGSSVSYGSFDISMAKLVFQPQIVIKHKDAGVLFDGFVTLDPLVQKRGVYSFYGLFQGVVVGGGVYYQPERNMLMVVITRGNEKVVTDLAFQVDQQVEKGDYTLSCAKMGQWSEIHVIRSRHRGFMVLGATIALIGLVLRIAIRPRRAWLKEAAAGCTLWSSDKETLSRMKAANY